MEDELETMSFSVTPGMLVGELGPPSCVFLQGKAGQQKTDPGKREGLLGGIFVAQGVQNERGSGESWFNDRFQICGQAKSSGQKEEPGKKHGSI